MVGENEKQIDPRPIVDSGAIVSVCPEWYVEHKQFLSVKEKMNLRSVLNEELKHYGECQGAFLNSSGCALMQTFQVTDIVKPVMSVRERVK